MAVTARLPFGSGVVFGYGQDAMKKTVLIFSDLDMMAMFLSSYAVFNAEINTRKASLRAVLTDTEIKIACLQYKASLERSMAGV